MVAGRLAELEGNAEGHFIGEERRWSGRNVVEAGEHPGRPLMALGVAERRRGQQGRHRTTKWLKQAALCLSTGAWGAWVLCEHRSSQRRRRGTHVVMLAGGLGSSGVEAGKRHGGAGDGTRWWSPGGRGTPSSSSGAWRAARGREEREEGERRREKGKKRKRKKKRKERGRERKRERERESRRNSRRRLRGRTSTRAG